MGNTRGSGKPGEERGERGEYGGWKNQPRDRSSQGATTKTTAVEDDGGSHPIFFSPTQG